LFGFSLAVAVVVALIIFSQQFTVGSAEGIVKFVLGLPPGPIFFLGRPSFFFSLKYRLIPFPPQYSSAYILLNIFLCGVMLFLFLSMDVLENYQLVRAITLFFIVRTDCYF